MLSALTMNITGIPLCWPTIKVETPRPATAKYNWHKLPPEVKAVRIMAEDPAQWDRMFQINSRYWAARELSTRNAPPARITDWTKRIL